MRMDVQLPGVYNSFLIDDNFIPSALVAKEVGLKKDTLQKRVKKGFYQGLEIVGNELFYEEKTGGKDIQLKTWNGRNTICYSKMLFSMIKLGEQEKNKHEFDFEYNFQDKITAESYRKNFDHVLARLRSEIDVNGALDAKTKKLLHLLKVLVISQNEDYKSMLLWFENDEPENSKQLRQVLAGKDQPPL